MAKQITDEEDRLKRQARRRLIGAVALTTAVVVVLPMVLDREPRPLGQNIELRIPDKDKAEAFNPKIDMPPASAVAAMPPASAPVAASLPASAVASVVPPAPAPVAAPTAVALAPAAAPMPQAVPAAPKVAVAEKTAPAPVKPATPESKPEPAKPPVKTEPAKPAPAKPDKAKPETKADKTKSDAKKEHAKKDGGAKTEQGQPAPTSGFIVQIGAFNNADTAHSWQKNLKAQGFKAYTDKVGGKTRVRVGPYATREAANAARKKIEKSQGLHSNVVELK